MILKSKLNVPLLRSGMLKRAHLLEKLSSGKLDRVILITGQAGAGKTSLVSQWIMREHLQTAWYSLDDTDNDPDLFYRYLLTALGNKNRNLAECFGPFLQSRRKLFAKDVFPSVIQYLDTLTAHLYLVLDDYHFITSEAIHEAISYLLRYLPPMMHVVIISRQKVPFPVSSFRIRNQLTEVLSSDLRLSELESERFLTDVMAVQISSEQIKELTGYAEGWIGGLQMIGLSLREGDNLKGLRDVRLKAGRMTAEYLVDEVIKVQPDNVRKFLFTTVLLNRFTEELCGHITGMKNVHEIIDYLCQTNLFIVPLDAGCRWYRYHNLFSEALGVRVKDHSVPDPSEIHRKAALWFAKNNYLEDAFRHAFASDDYEFAADMLEEYLYHFFDRYDVAGALRWISKLPRAILMQRALLRLDVCTFKVLSQEIGELETVLNEIEGQKEKAFKRYTGFKKRRCRSLLLYLQCRLPYYRDPANVDIDNMMRSFRKISDDNLFFHGAIETVIAQCGLQQGNLQLAEKTLQDATASVLSSGSAFRKMRWYKSIAELELWKGRLHCVEATVQKAFDYLELNEIDQVPLRFFLYLPMATVYYLRNELEKAMDYTRMCVRYAMQARHVNEIIAANFLLAQIYIAKGEPENVRSCVQDMQSASIDSARGTVAFLDAYITLLSLAKGDMRSAEQWAVRRKIREDERFSIRYFFESLAYALLMIHQRKYSDAVLFLDALHERCMKRNIILAVLHADILYSSALYALGEEDKARTIMEYVLNFAETEGYIRPFVDRWQFISPLLMDISTKALYKQNHLFLMKIFDACGIAADSSVQKRLSNADGANLSGRELEILKLMASGYRNKEIGRKVYISLDTVKTHVRHIYQKLDVSTRLQALTRARELDIL